MAAEPARDQIPEWDGQANTLERFEEDVLIFSHAVPKDRKVTLGPNLLQLFPKGSPQREICLELLKSGVLQLDNGATQLLKLIPLRLGKDLQQMCLNTINVSSIVLHVCINNQCNIISQNQTYMSEPCKQSDLCPIQAREEQKPRKSLPMSCVDFFFWKTQHLLDQNRCLFLALLEKVIDTITLQTR